jgi:hypothetical protein
MRSELIFAATAYESNRYQLCRLIAKGTRQFHRPNTRLPDTTNEVLERFVSQKKRPSTATLEPARAEHLRAA